MVNRQLQVIIILGAVLLAVVVGSAVVLWTFSSAPKGFAPRETVAQPETAESGVANGNGFDTTVLRSSRYTTLDQQLVNDGSLPVQPPASTGKANPFL